MLSVVLILALSSCCAVQAQSLRELLNRSVFLFLQSARDRFEQRGLDKISTALTLSLFRIADRERVDAPCPGLDDQGDGVMFDPVVLASVEGVVCVENPIAVRVGVFVSNDTQATLTTVTSDNGSTGTADGKNYNLNCLDRFPGGFSERSGFSPNESEGEDNLAEYFVGQCNRDAEEGQDEVELCCGKLVAGE